MNPTIVMLIELATILFLLHRMRRTEKSNEKLQLYATLMAHDLMAASKYVPKEVKEEMYIDMDDIEGNLP